MFSLKCLTKKFNKQSLNEVKPAPLSETVDNTCPSPSSPKSTAATSITNTTTTTVMTTPLAADHTPFCFLPPLPQPSAPDGQSLSDNDIDEDQPSQGIADISPDTYIPSSPSNMHFSATSMTSLFPTPAPPSSSPPSSDSEDTEDESPPPFPRSKGSPFSRARAHAPRKSLHTSELKIERISSAEKRKYSQYKCSTGGSSPSSSDDEIKEAFESTPTRHRNLHPLHSKHHAWAWSHPSPAPATNFTSPSFSPSTPPTTDQPLSGWNIEASSRPLKVVPVGRHKHKFFAQMSPNLSDRPFLDFNKMQHSKRLVMVRRPMVIRNNSRVHSIHQRSAPSSSLQVSLDISQHSFQPVLTQT